MFDMGVSALLAQLWPYVIGLGVALAGALGLYTKGKRDQARKEEHKRAEELLETRKRTDEQNYLDDDLAAARERLRKRGER